MSVRESGKQTDQSIHLRIYEEKQHTNTFFCLQISLAHQRLKTSVKGELHDWTCRPHGLHRQNNEQRGEERGHLTTHADLCSAEEDREGHPVDSLCTVSSL